MGGLVQKGTERKKTYAAAALWPEFQKFVRKLQEFIQIFNVPSINLLINSFHHDFDGILFLNSNYNR